MPRPKQLLEPHPSNRQTPKKQGVRNEARDARVAACIRATAAFTLGVVSLFYRLRAFVIIHIASRQRHVPRATMSMLGRLSRLPLAAYEGALLCYDHTR